MSWPADSPSAGIAALGQPLERDARGSPIGPGNSPLPERQPRILAVEGARWGFSGLESLGPPTGALAGIVISVMGAATLVLPELIYGGFQPVSAPPTTPGPTRWPHERPRAGGAGPLMGP
jgi:hypothetical protein